MTTSHRMLVRDVSADPYDLLPLDKKKKRSVGLESSPIGVAFGRDFTFACFVGVPIAHRFR